MTLPTRSLRALSTLGLVLCALSGCDADGKAGEPSTPSNPNGSTTFESDFPGADRNDDEGEDAAAGDGDSGDAPPAADDDGGGAERAIAEADVVQVLGNKLYTLSRSAGLGVIDLTNPAKLRLLGSARDLPAEPFEMYVRDNVVIAMFSEWGQYVAKDDGYVWVQTSKVVALDVRDPKAIVQLGSFDVPGMISDSRIVGDVLYVVGYQDGWCWGCQEQTPLTSVVSLDVKEPRTIRKVDELHFQDVDNEYGWNRRSITVTQQRMYVAGPEWGDSEGQGSTIEVVDISDPGGDLKPGATLEAEGQIQSRWQMDEHEGVLRVISQTPSWDLDVAPVVQTFSVKSSTEITALGRMELTLPRPEQLQSVRFDGARAYAITFERTDPLFTIDLTDPAAPKQMGELEMPGFLYHMVPRGDRMLGLGYDQNNPEGAITLSVFDVSDLSKPTMLDRVNFGGNWASLPEDQDRIHKALRIYDELGLVAVPYSGWSGVEENCWYSDYHSGVQLVDLAGDDLTLRGAVPTVGQARRAFVHANNLYTFSDERVTSYAISDRDAPLALGELVLARNVSHALPLANGTVARVTQDWWSSQRMFVDVVNASDAELAHTSLAELDLGRALSLEGCDGYLWISAAFARGNQLELVYQREQYDEDYKRHSGVLVVDLADPKKPRVAGKLEWPTDSNWYWYSGSYAFGYNTTQAAYGRTEHALVLLEASDHYDYENEQYHSELKARVVDMRDPAHLTQTALKLADENTSYSGLVVSGNSVLTSHHEPGDQGRVRFYFDRIDVSDPKAPVRLAPVNVPGSLLHYEPAQQRLLTQELRKVVVPGITWEQCYQRFAYADIEYEGDDYERGTCVGFVQRVNLVSLDGDGAHLLDSMELAENQLISSLSVGTGRIFVSLGAGYRGYYYDDVEGDCWGPCGGTSTQRPMEILVLGGYAGDKLSRGLLSVEKQTQPWWGFWGTPPVYASGTRALLVSHGEAAVIDAADLSAPKVLRTQKVHGYLSSVHVEGGEALLSLSTGGVQRIDMLE